MEVTGGKKATKLQNNLLTPSPRFNHLCNFHIVKTIFLVNVSKCDFAQNREERGALSDN